MNDIQKQFAKITLQNKILKSNGQTFEDLFIHIMRLNNPNFRPIKPQGQIGDRKNDGYDSINGIYYQVYAPENLETTINKVIKKLNEDFKGLKNG